MDRTKQAPIFHDHITNEDPDYLSKQLMTCIGNKRALLGQIGEQITNIKGRIGKEKLRVWDAFAGSGVVSRYFKAHAELLVSSDIEDFAIVAGECHLRNRSNVNMSSLAAVVDDLNQRVDVVDVPMGFIEEMYAPRDDENIMADERVFYTRHNARRLDNYRRLLYDISYEHRTMLLGPLLSEASIHANTAGVFKGFYKDRHTGIGRFGGSNADALTRIKGPITLAPPILSLFDCDVDIHQQDANKVAHQVSNLDIAYLDPPYNQHPYGSNYFMLNLVANYKRPLHTSKVSGIPADWKRSDYNRRQTCLPRLRELVCAVDAKFILVSFNNEGFIAPDEMRTLLGEFGTVETTEIRYNTFRGSRNLSERDIHVVEQLFLVERR
jgi:adenine-specific DNA-methyltransferase